MKLCNEMQCFDKRWGGWKNDKIFCKNDEKFEI